MATSSSGTASPIDASPTPIDRDKVKKDFAGISSDLLRVRKRVSKQMSCESKSIRSLKAELKRRKHAKRRLAKQKKAIESNLHKIHGSMAYITNDHVSTLTWSSDSDDKSAGTSSEDEPNTSVS